MLYFATVEQRRNRFIEIVVPGCHETEAVDQLMNHISQKVSLCALDGIVVVLERRKAPDQYTKAQPKATLDQLTTKYQLISLLNCASMSYCVHDGFTLMFVYCLSSGCGYKRVILSVLSVMT